jgi:hypothetical protein
MRSTFTHPYRFGKLNERFGEISDCRLLISDLAWCKTVLSISNQQSAI